MSIFDIWLLLQSHYQTPVGFTRTQMHFEHYQGYMRGDPGGRLNKKDGLTRYGNSHVKDKTS